MGSCGLGGIHVVYVCVCEAHALCFVFVPDDFLTVREEKDPCLHIGLLMIVKRCKTTISPPSVNGPKVTWLMGSAPNDSSRGQG